MPVVRRRGHLRAYVANLSQGQEAELKTGWYHVGGFGRGLRAIELMEAAWELHGERITAEYMEEAPILLRGITFSNMGTRPYGWWRWTHRRERPILPTCPLTPEEIDTRWRNVDRKQIGGFLHTDKSYHIQEREVDYLYRNGLLTEVERKALGR